MDDAAGEFTNVLGYDVDTLSLSAVVEVTSGLTYAFKYRVRNMYGWSDFSAITHILAASVPSTPAKPEFVQSTDNSITIKLFQSESSNGSPITEYVLEIDAGELESSFTEVLTYVRDSFEMQHTVTFADDNILTGKIYSFRFKSFNSKGYSEYSEILSVAAVNPPLKAATPQNDYSFSSRTSVFVNWQLNEDGLGSEGGLISGYKLFMDDGEGGDFEVVYDTVGYSSHLDSFLATNLTTSALYRFRLQAYNYNTLQPGEISDILYVYVCDEPSALQKPQQVTTTTEAIKIQWNEP